MADSYVVEDQALYEERSQDDPDVFSLEELCALLEEAGDVVISTSCASSSVETDKLCRQDSCVDKPTPQSEGEFSLVHEAVERSFDGEQQTVQEELSAEGDHFSSQHPDPSPPIYDTTTAIGLSSPETNCFSVHDSCVDKPIPQSGGAFSNFDEEVELSLDSEQLTVQDESAVGNNFSDQHFDPPRQNTHCQESNNTSTEDNEQHDIVVEVQSSTSSRKRGRVNVDSRTWAAEETKAKRMKGEAYVGYKRLDKKKTKMVRNNIEREAKKLRERCTSERCRNVSTRQCNKVDEETRLALFKSFWERKDWKEKKVFVATLVHQQKPKQRSKKAKKQREVSYVYHLKVKDNLLPVCRTMFLNTLGLTNETIRHWLKASFSEIGSSEPQVAPEQDEAEIDIVDNPHPPDDNLSFNAPRTASSMNSRKTHLQDFLNTAPKLPSHYCRKSTSKLYLQTDVTSMTDFYKLYISKCSKDGFQPLSRWAFDRECQRKNIDIYVPKKDLCDLCFKHEKKNVNDEQYYVHMELKDSARDEKNKDKQLAEKNQVWVLECDVMAVKLLPFMQASASYYKMKLAIHNYTIYNLGNHDGLCLWFTENEGDLSASSFATLLVQEIERLINEEKRDVVIISDGCTNQNRNCIMSNALLSLAMNKGVFIYQKYLEKGHTQMEGDSVHSVIEGAMKNKEFFLPHELVSLTKQARAVPMPYRSRLVYHYEFKDFSKAMRYTSIRPGNKPQDPCVTDIRVLQYDPTGVTNATN